MIRVNSEPTDEVSWPASKDLRLAYLVNQFPQPSQTFIRREIAALEELGQRVDRYAIRLWPGQLQDPADRTEAERVRVVLNAGLSALLSAVLGMLITRPWRFFKTLRWAFSLGWRGHPGVMKHLCYFFEACLLARWWKASAIDHVHVHFGTNATTVVMLAKSLGGPSYSFTVHGPEEFDKPEALHLGKKIENAKFVVAISSFGRSQLCRWCDYNQWSKIRVVRCGLDEVFLRTPSSPIPSAPHLVCVARLEEQKGLCLLIEALGRLKAKGTDFRLRLIGDGRMRGIIERLIEQHELTSSVELLGWKSSSDVRAEILRSRGLVLPSFAEGLPVVIMEALALSRPVIATGVGGIAELVEGGVSGWLIPAGALEPLENAIHELLRASPDELSILAARGAELVRQHHDAKREAASLLEHFTAPKPGLASSHAGRTANRGAASSPSDADAPHEPATIA